MPWKLELLKQGARLRQRAQAHTRDVNEAYFLVHGVMAHALGSRACADHDLDLALTRAFQRRPEAAQA